MNVGLGAGAQLSSVLADIPGLSMVSMQTGGMDSAFPGLSSAPVKVPSQYPVPSAAAVAAAAAAATAVASTPTSPAPSVLPVPSTIPMSPGSIESGAPTPTTTTAGAATTVSGGGAGNFRQSRYQFEAELHPTPSMQTQHYQTSSFKQYVFFFFDPSIPLSSVSFLLYKSSHLLHYPAKLGSPWLLFCCPGYQSGRLIYRISC